MILNSGSDRPALQGKNEGLGFRIYVIQLNQGVRPVTSSTFRLPRSVR